MNTVVINALGIDVRTEDKHMLIARLQGLVSTVRLEDGGLYREDPNYSQVWVWTHKDIEALDDWLYKTKGIEYVGTFERKEAGAG